MKKGVYVENLKECEVSSVKDVLELLLKVFFTSPQVTLPILLLLL